MRFWPRNRPKSGAKRTCAGFTLAEVLAALVFMAIVIPVAVEGVRIANRAGLVAQRKAVALRLAERVLQELIVTGQWQQSSQRGTLEDRLLSYSWEAQVEPWDNGILRLLTVRMTFPVQGQEHELRLSTLVDTPSTSAATTPSTTSTQ